MIKKKCLWSLPAERLPLNGDDYEDFSDLSSPGGIGQYTWTDRLRLQRNRPPSGLVVKALCRSAFSGFNCRVQKPKGPREPPAEWSRLER